jgi:TPR repeat protein
MIKKMGELFIYYVLSTEKEGTKDFCLKGCVNATQKALNTIKNENLQAWNKHLKNVFAFYKNGTHPGLNIQNELMKLSQEEYIQDIEKIQDLFRKYSKMGTSNYDSLYLVASEKDVSRLSYSIILRNKSLKEIKNLLDKELEKTNKNQEILAILTNELCWKYRYGSKEDINFDEAIKGWKMIADYLTDAKYELAWCYFEGKGIKKDKEKAYNIFCEIMSKDIRAKFEVARLNLFGEGTLKNENKAFNIFTEMKEKVPYDMEKLICKYLGRMYLYGLGVAQDKKKGLELLEKAWNSGLVEYKYDEIKKALKEYYGIND